MNLEHNHTKFAALADKNCLKCRLNLYAEELLLAAEKVVKGIPNGIEELDIIIDKIRGDK